MKTGIDKKGRLSAALQELKHQVTQEMKVAASVKYGLGITTINEYLRGDVGNIPTAEALVKFFRKAIIKQVA